jgi:4-amino-4-deoxy-L-arabinose transferase-like glycosyltransferase
MRPHTTSDTATGPPDRGPAPAAEADSASRPIGEAAAVAMIAGASLLLFSALALHPPTGSDARYVEAAREMVESRDFVVPHLGHVPYFEKPVLAYWLGAASQALLGLSPLAARLPSILATVGSVVMTWLIGRELRGPRLGLVGAGVVATCAIVPVTASVLLTDQPLAFFHALATFAYLRHERAPRSGWIWMAWAALGFGVLAKGPVALALAGVSILAWLAADRRLADVLRLRPLRGLAVVAAINVPWWWLVWERDPRFVDFFFVRMNLGGFLHGGVNHAQGPWYYFATLPLALFPWTLVACAAVAAAARTDLVPAVRAALTRRAAPAGDRTRLFLACMVVAPLLFLTVSASKLWYYTLPLCPAIALLVADHVIERPRHGRFLRNAPFITAGLLAAVLVAAWIAAKAGLHERLRLDAAWLPAEAAVAVVAVGALVAGGVLVRRGSAARGIAVAAVGTTACLVPAYLVAERALSGGDASAVAARVAQVQRDDDRILVDDHFAQDYTVQLAVKRRVGIVGRARELGIGLFAEATPPSRPFPDVPHEVDSGLLPEQPWLYDMRRLAREWKEPRRIWLIWSAEPHELERLHRVGIEPVELARDGDIVALTNRP